MLEVGFGAKRNDVRLGDVVVSPPTGLMGVLSEFWWENPIRYACFSDVMVEMCESPSTSVIGRYVSFLTLGL